MRSCLLTLIFLCQIILFDFDSTLNSFVEQVASKFHHEWKENYLRQNPHVKNRFKLTTDRDKYRNEEFIYPMILTVGSTLVHRNFKVAQHKMNSSWIFVDILNLNYEDLPDDWAKENRQTAEIACEQLLQYVRRNFVFDRKLIEEISDKIHQNWIQRNQHRSNIDLLQPYRNLSEIEKEKDRRAIRIAANLFNRKHFYQIFRTNPIRMRTEEF